VDLLFSTLLEPLCDQPTSDFTPYYFRVVILITDQCVVERENLFLTFGEAEVFLLTEKASHMRKTCGRRHRPAVRIRI